MNTNRLLIALLSAVFAVSLTACASKTPGQPMQVASIAQDDSAANDDNDPFETVNRGIFEFNRMLDGVLLSPIAHIYRGLLPDVAQTSVKNALTNLNAPVVFFNSVMQWDMPNAGRTLERFVVNSTVGIAGLWDAATYMGIEKEHRKDFGQTLGVYGLSSGPYLMLPILGPSSARDGVGLVADVFDDPWTYVFTTGEQVARDATRMVVTRADLLPFTDRVYRDSLDPYATFRSAYLQHRAKVVRDYRGEDATLFEKETGK